MPSMVKAFIRAAAAALLLLFFCPLQALADPQDELLEILDSTPAFSARFSQTVHKSDGSTVSGSRGTIALRQTGEMLMHSEEPDEQILFAKGDLVCFYDPFVNQVTLFSRSQLQDSPFLLLTRSGRSNWNNYQVTKKGGEYVLRSKKRTTEVQELRLRFEGGMVSRIALVMQDGSLNVYTLSSRRRSVDPGAFDFKIPEDAEIDDERGAK